MALDLTTAQNVLKIDYLPPLRDVLNHNTVLLHRLSRNTEDVVGSQAYVSLNTTRTSGIGSRPEGGTLPTAGNQGYNAATFTMKQTYGRIQLSGLVIAAAQSDEGSFIRAVDSEMKGMVRDALDDENRQLFGDATGTLAIVTLTNGAATATATGRDLTKYLTVGMVVDFRDPAHATPYTVSANGAARVITAINRSTGVITSSGGNFAAATTGIRISRQGNVLESAGSGTFYEMFGLQNVINNANVAAPHNPGNFGNIDRSTVEAWQATVKANGGTLRNLSLDLMEESVDDADLNGAGVITLIVTTHALYRKYASLLIPDRRYPTAGGAIEKLDGGFRALMYDDIPVVKDKHCPNNKMFFLAESSIVLFEMADWDWMDKDGSILRRVANADAYEATLFKYRNLGAYDPRDNVLLDDIQ